MRVSLRCSAAVSVVLLLALAVPGCSEDDPVGPSTGEIEVRIVIDGQDLDPDGYAVVLEEVGEEQLPTGGDLATFKWLTPGTYVVELANLADNCHPAGSTRRTANVAAGLTTFVTYDVGCDPRVGTLRVTVATTGEDLDEDGYWLVVNGDDYGAVPAPVNGVVTIPQVHEGPVTVTLGGVVENCAAAAASPAPALVSYLGTAEVAIGVTCVPTGSIRVRAATSGIDVPAGYEIRVTRVGEATADARAVAPTGDASFTRLLPDDYDVTLFDSPENCALAEPVTRRVAVRARETVDLSFTVTCTPARLLALSLRNGASSDIAAVKSNGEGVDWLAESPAEEIDPQWSPDGSRIAFVSWRDGNEEIYVMNADGSSPVRLTNDPATDADPAWSPDGTKIAFRSHRDGDAEVYIMNADGTGVVALTSHPGWDGAPAWSPDGRRIAYVRNPCVQFCYGFYQSLIVIALDEPGAGSELLTEEGLRDPSWSPDGRWLAVATECYYYCYDRVLLVKVETGAVRALVGGTASRPSWKP